MIGQSIQTESHFKTTKNHFWFCKILFHVFFFRCPDFLNSIWMVYIWQKKTDLDWQCEQSLNAAVLQHKRSNRVRVDMGSVFKNGTFFTLPLLYCLIILFSSLFSSVPSVISMQMSSSLHYPDCDWARFVSGLALQHPLLSLKWHFNLLQLAGVTLLLINLQHYCLFDFGMWWAFYCIHVRWVQ